MDGFALGVRHLALLVGLGLIAFGVDDTNISISIATLLMVFILQDTQNRDSAAIHPPTSIRYSSVRTIATASSCTFESQAAWYGFRRAGQELMQALGHLALALDGARRLVSRGQVPAEPKQCLKERRAGLFRRLR